MESMVSDLPEYWRTLNENPQYLISNHGRVKNLNSYSKKPKIIVPSLRRNKYLYISISIGNKRKTLSLIKLHRFYFN